MAEVGIAYVTIAPSLRGFGNKLQSQVAPQADRAGKSSGSKFGVGFGKAVAAVGGVAAIGGIIKRSSELEQEFGKTMNVLQATSGASGREMQNLSKLAMKMGADTVFSANDASKAMLELARGGITPAGIAAGALQGTLTLAAAGELEMGEAANIAVKSMGQFNLEGKDMSSIAAALAGGANASSASVRDMSMALAQGGLAANSVGFSIQETTGVLAAFSNAGLEGADAGTAMKTMLDRLQPATGPTNEAMMELGIVTKDGANAFIKANGQFKSAAQIAGVLQKATEGLSDAEAKRLITAAFGSDAQRAATIFAKEGAKGLRELTKQTSDQSAAEKQAAANMKGTAGAMERLSGSVETAQLALGQALAPTIVKVADFLSDKAVPAATNFIEGMRTGEGAGGDFAAVLGEVVDVGKGVFGVARDVHDVISDLPGPVKEYGAKAAIAAVGVKKLVDASSGLRGITSLAGLAGGKLGSKGFGGGALGGASRTPVPVFVTNLGKAGALGAGAGAGAAGGGKGRGRGRGVGTNAGLAAAAVVGLGALETSLDDVGAKGKETGNKLFASFDKPKGGVAEFLFGPGNTMQADFQRALSSLNAGTAGKIGADLDRAFGGSGLSVGVENIKALDAALVALNKSDPSAAMDSYLTAAQKSGLTSAELARVLPKATEAFRGQAKATGDVGSLLRQTIPQLARYDTVLRGFPKAAVTEISAKGLPKTRAGIVDLTRRYRLTPDMVSTLIREQGGKPTRNMVDGIIESARVLDRQRPHPKATLDDQVSRPLRRTNLDLTATDKRVAKPEVRLNSSGFFGALAGVAQALDHAARPRTAFINVRQTGSGAQTVAARATGGPVSSGRMYLVGERGPELFTARQSGYITSNDALRSSGGTPVGVATGGGLSGPVTLVVGEREMQAWFEDSFDAEMALN